MNNVDISTCDHTYGSDYPNSRNCITFFIYLANLRSDFEHFYMPIDFNLSLTHRNINHMTKYTKSLKGHIFQMNFSYF